MLSLEESLIRILLVDDHRVVRAGLRAVINKHESLQIVAEAASGAEAVAYSSATQPDIILLDLDLGPESGLDVLPALVGLLNGAQVLLLTGVRDAEMHRRAMQHGARGLVSKDAPIETLVKAIEKVYAGELWLERAMVSDLFRDLAATGEAQPSSDAAARISRLTTRERELIMLIGAGLKNPQIADRLSISEATVRNHITSVFSKLAVNDRLDLVIFAYRHALAKLPA